MGQVLNMNKTILILFILLLGFSFNSFAKDHDKNNTSIYGGGGFFSKPTYEGSSSRRFMWIPMVALRYEDHAKTTFNSFEILGPVARLTVFDNKNFKFGIFGQYEFGRQNGDDNSLVGLEEIDSHFSTGLNLQYSLPFDFSLNYEITTDVKDFYSDSYSSSFGLSYEKSSWITFEQPLTSTTSLTLHYANSDYLNEWFGTPSPAFGDPKAMYKYYKPDSGFYKTSLSNTTVFPLSDKVLGLVNIGYDRLLGEASDSQLVKRQGSSNQFSLMFTAMYKFYSF